MYRTGIVVMGTLLLMGVSAATYVYVYEKTPETVRPMPLPESPGIGVVGNEKTDTDPFDVAIEYTDEGYVPRDISIAKGTRVRFINHSSLESWPASGVHPTHTLYPEKATTDCLGSSFDSCDALSPGEFFDYTFFYEGRRPFHDHLRGYHSGTITVTP